MPTKQIDFKAQPQIGLIAGALSGIAGITLAVMSYGVWSLVEDKNRGRESFQETSAPQAAHCV